MDIHDSNYQEKREAKQARYEELAEKNHKLANEQFEQAIKMGEFHRPEGKISQNYIINYN